MIHFGLCKKPDKLPVKVIIKLDNGNSSLSNEVMITVFYSIITSACQYAEQQALA